jgi:hypothetical protein
MAGKRKRVEAIGYASPCGPALLVTQDPSRTPSVHRSARDNIDLSEEQGAVRD